MKIAILVQDITKLGGVETVTVWLAEQFGKENEVDIISCKKQFATSYNGSDKIHIEYLSIPIEHKHFTASDFDILKKLLEIKNYDKIIVQLSTAFKNLCFVANPKLYRFISSYAKVYVCIHGSPKYFITRYNTSSDYCFKFLLKKIYHFIRYRTEIKEYFRLSNKYVDSFITLSKGCHDELKKYYGLDSIIRYNPYNFDNEIVNIEEKENVILWAGRFSPEKNIMLLLKAWNEIKDKKNWKVVIIGSGEQENLINNYITSFNMKDVELLPAMPHSALMEYFKKSKIYVVTSFFEGFPTVICEAMNYKNAVISTKHDGYSRELLDNTTGIVTPIDSFELSRNIEKLLNDNNLLIKYQNAGYERCKANYQALSLNANDYFKVSP